MPLLAAVKSTNSNKVLHFSEHRKCNGNLYFVFRFTFCFFLQDHNHHHFKQHFSFIPCILIQLLWSWSLSQLFRTRTHTHSRWFVRISYFICINWNTTVVVTAAAATTAAVIFIFHTFLFIEMFIVTFANSYPTYLRTRSLFPHSSNKWVSESCTKCGLWMQIKTICTSLKAFKWENCVR